MNKHRQEGLDILSRLTPEQRDNPHILNVYSRKYGLNADCMLNFCSQRIENIIFSFLYLPDEYFGDFNAKMDRIVQIEEVQGKKFRREIYDEPQNILIIYFNFDPKKANELVDFIDNNLNKESIRKFFKKNDEGLDLE